MNDFRQYKRDIHNLLTNLIIGLEISSNYKYDLSTYTALNSKTSHGYWIFKIDPGHLPFPKRKFLNLEIYANIKGLYVKVDTNELTNFQGKFDAYSCEELFEYPIELDKGKLFIFCNQKEDIINIVLTLLKIKGIE